LRTLVAIPTLLTTLEAIEETVDRLEIHYLASPDGELHFALLSDWTDADDEHGPDDAVLLDAAARAIERLNRQHPPTAAGSRFMLLHRRRSWSDTQRKWMGWERKRGKLHELNRLLRGATDTTFFDAGAGRSVVPDDVRYVITLDADTRLPRETARRLIGKLSHPLNRPRLDDTTRRVVEGYAVLQPRVTPSLPMNHEGHSFNASSRARPGSIRMPPRCPTSTRTCLARALCRQGHLRRRRLRGRARRSRSRRHAAEP
jgi:cyclic beta-1,2-glucan synthetase